MSAFRPGGHRAGKRMPSRLDGELRQPLPGGEPPDDDVAVLAAGGEEIGREAWSHGDDSGR